MRLGLALATVRFDAFPRDDFVALRALPRAVTWFLCCTFDRFFSLAMIGPSQCVGSLSVDIDADQMTRQSKVLG